jgi:hypothetical protein
MDVAITVRRGLIDDVTETKSQSIESCELREKVTI